MKSMEAYLVARYDNNSGAMSDALKSYRTGLLSSPGDRVKFSILEKETWLNKANLFTLSLVFYLFGFILLGISWMVQPILLKNVANRISLIMFLLITINI